MPTESRPLKSPLRFGLLCTSDFQPLWIRKLLGDLFSANIISIVLIVVRNSSDQSFSGRVGRAVGNALKRKSSWLYLLYRVCARVFFRRHPDAQTLGRLDYHASVLSKIEINVVGNRSGIPLTEEQIGTITSHDLDLVFCSNVRLKDAGNLGLAKYGIWTIEHVADFDGFTTEPAFWEVMESVPVLKVEVRRHDANFPQGQVLWQSFSPTHLPDDLWSFRGASNRFLWLAATGIHRALNALYLKRDQALKEFNQGRSREPVLFAPSSPPSNKKMLRLAVKRTVQRTRAWARSLTGFDQWSLAYRLDRSVENSFGIHGLTTMLPPKDRFWADPFPLKHGDRFWIFMEEFLNSTKKGHISVIQMDHNGCWQQPTKIIERDYHMSYPFVFQWDGCHYMVPETGSNRTVELYKSVCFPFEWELERILMEDIEAADPTLVEFDGLWWLFVATRPYQVMQDDNYMELSLFYCDTPLGPWTPHRSNPVKSDARSSRPAGRLFWWNGTLYRPAQDCSQDYGYAVSINRISRLTPEEFEEEEAAKILPEWIGGAMCVHTLNTCERLTVVDFMRRVSRLQ